ncbi:MAG: HAD hydrolase family protein [Pseudomonadota bacterium]
MTNRPDLLVFSDLDGTLLDHETYSWAAAAGALNALRSLNAGLVLASSKTAAEIIALRAEIGFDGWPSIVENGSGLIKPGANASRNGAVYRKLRQKISGLPKGFRGFGDMSKEEIVKRTGLSIHAAQNAQQRQFSEPGIWEGEPSELDKFSSFASAAGLTVQHGGRFITLSFGGTKADRVAELIARFKPKTSIILGDAPNDIGMLELADYGVIVANPASPDLPHMQGERTGQIRRTDRTGPKGWADAVLKILEELSVGKDTKAHG